MLMFQSCAWGNRKNVMSSMCELCSSSLPLYDWLYLGFMGLLPVLLHSFCIEYCGGKARKSTTKILALQHVSSVLESIVAAVISLLVMNPRGSLAIDGCGVKDLRDWYTMFFNPTINYSRTLHCTQEAAYPL